MIKLRIALLLIYLFGVGLFAPAQQPAKAKPPEKPVVENGRDAIPIVVRSTKKAKRKEPPKVEDIKFTPPVLKKSPGIPVPPPPPAKATIRANAAPVPPPLEKKSGIHQPSEPAAPVMPALFSMF